ncbi:FAD-binding oxidoreductase [Candidatus Kapaibacterium sp.]
MINIKYDSEVIYPYTYDSSNLRGSADLLLIPKSIDELSESLKYCFDNNIKVTISGAGTGITGARVPFGGAIISTERYKHIEISEDLNFVKCGSAVTLKELEDYLEQFNRFLPPNPTEYNASIGGNTATNASGARTFKYGAIRQYINSLTIVLMNGDILYLTRGQNFVNDNNATIISTNGNNYNFNIPNYQMPNIKNASGYYVRENMDVIDLFIGSEGTLGVFYEIVLKVLPRPEYILGGVIYFDDSNKLYEFVSNLRNLSRRDNSIINSRLIEYFDRKSLDLLKPKYNEIPDLAVGAIWFEQEYSNENEEILLESWYEFISNFTTLIDNTWFAMNSKEHERLKEFRHELPLQVYENLTNNSQKKVGLGHSSP